uniref:Uncharacterized protein n=1 Tax=Oryza nivara TaxID=4536 RepID=A0A0E0FIW7_ORYNI
MPTGHGPPPAVTPAHHAALPSTHRAAPPLSTRRPRSSPGAHLRAATSPSPGVARRGPPHQSPPCHLWNTRARVADDLEMRGLLITNDSERHSQSYKISVGSPLCPGTMYRVSLDDIAS